MACPNCESLQVNADTYYHQRDCPDYGGKDKDADILRNKLNGVELGMWADTVLASHPKNLMAKKPIVTVIGKDEYDTPIYRVTWTYPGFSLVFERAERDHPKYGRLSVYAVQEILSNNEHKRKRRQYRSVRRSGKQKGGHIGTLGNRRK